MSRGSRWVLLVGLVLLAGLLVGCESHGSVRNSRVRCKSGMGEGSCEGTFGSVRGDNAYTLEDVDRAPGTAVWLDLELSIATGALRVTLDGDDGQEIVTMARPGQPVEYAGTISTDAMGHVSIGMSVPEGEVAEGVAFRAAWELQ